METYTILSTPSGVPNWEFWIYGNTQSLKHTAASKKNQKCGDSIHSIASGEQHPWNIFDDCINSVYN